MQARMKLFCHVVVNNYLCNVLCTFLAKIESSWTREIKKQTLQLILLCCGRTVRSSHRRCSIKKLFLKNLQYPQETLVLESLFKTFFKKSSRRSFIKKRSQHRCFLVNNRRFLRLPILKNICERLFFDYFNGSLLHGPKSSRSRLYYGIRLQGPSHWSSFLFLSRHLWS